MAIQKRGGGWSERGLKMGMGVMGMCVVGYIVVPPLYWHFLHSLSSSSSSSCLPCFCDCFSHPLLSLPLGLNMSFTDCMKQDPHVNEETQNNFVDLVADDLKRKELEDLENQRHSDVALLEAKKLASQYQKEADKCNSGMETCEEAREKAEEALESQRKLTSMWESRARQKGWKESNMRGCQGEELLALGRETDGESLRRHPIKLERYGGKLMENRIWMSTVAYQIWALHISEAKGRQ